MNEAAMMRVRPALLAAVLFAAARPAVAAGDEWRFEATPYLFAAGLDGDVKVGRLAASGVETSFSDLTKILDYGFMGTLEGRRGDFGFLADAIYLKVSDSADTPGGGFGNAHAAMTQQLYAMAATWRIPDVPVDLVGGLRYLRIKADLELTSGNFAGRRAVDTRNFTDAYVGVRLQAPVADRWTVVGYADVGAGGSDLSYQFVGAVNYASSKDVTWKAGYRFMSVDYRKDAFVYDIDYAGPYLGVGLRF